MSSTRRAKDNSQFHQNRFASSGEFERGLLGNLVARRVAVLDDKAERELIWFIHYLSHQEGGIPALVAELIRQNPDEFKDYEIGDLRMLPAKDELEKSIKSICLDPAFKFTGRHWPYPAFVPALRKLQEDYIKRKKPAFSTELGSKIADVLDYTAFGGGLTLMEGEARTGKTFAARAWCEQRPGKARYAEVPPGNDEAGFFRTLARALGLGNFLSYKVCEIRDRVESVLLTKNLLLVLDEGQRLWPQRNLRYGFPARITWVMTMANAGVSIAMVSTPQFIEIQRAVEKSGWNSRQLVGRIKHYEPLPPELSLEDLAGVARAVLPEANSEVVKALAIYARNSARYLAAIDSIADRARYLAMKDGRRDATTMDVRKAMKESVIPSDSKLQSTLAIGQPRRGHLPALSPKEAQNDFSAPRERSVTPAAETPLVGV